MCLSSAHEQQPLWSECIVEIAFRVKFMQQQQQTFDKGWACTTTRIPAMVARSGFAHVHMVRLLAPVLELAGSGEQSTVR